MEKDNDTQQCICKYNIYCATLSLLCIIIHPENNKTTGCQSNQTTCYQRDRLNCYQNNMYPCFVGGIFMMMCLILLFIIIFVPIYCIIWCCRTKIIIVDQTQIDKDDDIISLDED